MKALFILPPKVTKHARLKHEANKQIDGSFPVSFLTTLTFLISWGKKPTNTKKTLTKQTKTCLLPATLSLFSQVKSVS